MPQHPEDAAIPIATWLAANSTEAELLDFVVRQLSVEARGRIVSAIEWADQCDRSFRDTPEAA